jgi:hypothetical protein
MVYMYGKMTMYVLQSRESYLPAAELTKISNRPNLDMAPATAAAQLGGERTSPLT